MTADVIAFPRLNELEDALAELVAGNATYMPMVQAVDYIRGQHASAFIRSMTLEIWTKHIVRRMVRMEDPDRHPFARDFERGL
ncbi:hypothetical protein LCGC14_0471800 [marine sediment metagenome]|uniref:Uncharacterized protein n=1 Tax=marine sediment metagenome TaxID=412755 RepID=A0A0F9SH43_9ZZZZ